MLQFFYCFFQAEDGIRDFHVTGVQTCALPICSRPWSRMHPEAVLWLAVEGIREHTPLAVVIPRRGKLRVIRFFKAFQDSKHGQHARLQAAEQELENAMSE